MVILKISNHPGANIMKICIVGGIFDKPETYRNKHAFTPETILVDGLIKRGEIVYALGHRNFRPSSYYDIVHVHHLGIAALRMAIANTKALFVFTGHNGPLLCGYDRSILRKVIFKLIIHRADAVIALSRTEAVFIEKLAHLNKKKVYLIPNGVPSEIFLRQKEDYNYKDNKDGPFRILFVGQLIPLKGVDVLLKAFALISGIMKAELWLVYQNAENELKYRMMAKQLGLENKIKFIGFLSAPELAQVYKSVDVFILPSYAESLPSTITEAMLCGTPIIASSVGGIPEQLGGFGRTFRPGDYVQLANIIIDVKNRHEAYKAQSKKMIEYAERNFSVKIMIDMHLNLYNFLIKKK